MDVLLIRIYNRYIYYIGKYGPPASPTYFNGSFLDRPPVKTLLAPTLSEVYNIAVGAISPNLTKG